jgi:glycerol kinase
MDERRRAAEYRNWQRAVELTFGWMRPDDAASES